MAGYTRNDTAGNIADGNIISAAPLDGEFDAIEGAFNASTGHTHDGTAANGGRVTKLGPSGELTQAGSTLTVTTDVEVSTNKHINSETAELGLSLVLMVSWISMQMAKSRLFRLL